jgi:hypothetical protein
MPKASETDKLAKLVGIDLQDGRGRNRAYVCVPVILLEMAVKKLEALQPCKKSQAISGPIPLTYE